MRSEIRQLEVRVRSNKEGGSTAIPRFSIYSMDSSWDSRGFSGRHPKQVQTADARVKADPYAEFGILKP